MRFLRRTECVVSNADNHSKIGENAIGHFRVSKSRWVLNNYDYSGESATECLQLNHLIRSLHGGQSVRDQHNRFLSRGLLQ